MLGRVTLGICTGAISGGVVKAFSLDKLVAEVISSDHVTAILVILAGSGGIAGFFAYPWVRKYADAISPRPRYASLLLENLHLGLDLTNISSSFELVLILKNDNSDAVRFNGTFGIRLGQQTMNFRPVDGIIPANKEFQIKGQSPIFQTPEIGHNAVAEGAVRYELDFYQAPSGRRKRTTKREIAIRYSVNNLQLGDNRQGKLECKDTLHEES